jgi:hypothetical protein
MKIGSEVNNIDVPDLLLLNSIPGGGVFLWI